MNEQYYIDWLNSLDIPEATIIDRIDDLLYKGDIILRIISKILNKKIEELITVIDSPKPKTTLENISILMNLYFDYNYDYSNKSNLKKNTILLIQFLKSRYPKNTNKKTIKDKNEKKDTNNNNNNNNNENFSKIINNDNQLLNLNKNNFNEKERNDKGNNRFHLNFINHSKTINEKNKFFNKQLKNFKTASNRNTSEDNILSSKNLPSKKNLNISKSFSSNYICKTKEIIKTDNNRSLDKFTKKIKKSNNIQNNFLKTIGHPILKKDDYYNYYQFPKITSPVIKINIEPLNTFNKINKNINNNYKFPFLLQHITQKNKNQKYEINEFNSSKPLKEKKNYELNEIDKKEEFILDYLNKIKIINVEQKNRDYLWKKLIPDLKDGCIIGKLINLLEKKNNNYLKGISKETFYKVNIYYNWQKIKDFLINKNSFNSIYLYQKNFYYNDKMIFNFLYNLLKFYSEKENINININKYKNYNHKYHINISNIQNISNYIVSDNSNYSKNISNINKSVQNKSYYSTSITKNNRNKKIRLNNNYKEKKCDSNMSITPPISEIMNIRKNIKYIHRQNNSFILLPSKEYKYENKDIKNFKNFDNSKNPNLKKSENLNFYAKGENISFDKKVNNILSILELIGINTSQINFYVPEMKIFKDGILLHQIISRLESNASIIPKIDLNPKKPSNAINNHRLLINFLNKYKKNFPVELLEKERELYKGDPKFILKFLYILKSIYNNEIFYYKNKKEERNKKINKSIINPKNIDKSERMTIPLSQDLRNKFLIKNNAQIWA